MEQALTGGGTLLAENALHLTFDVLDLRRVNIVKSGATVLFTAALTVSENGPGTPSSALRVRSLGNVVFNGPVTATAAGALNIDVAGFDITINDNVQATGTITVSASRNLSIAAVLVAADSDGNGGQLRLRGDADLQDGGILNAAPGSTLSGATVQLAGAGLIVDKLTATAGDAILSSTDTATLNGTLTVAAGSVVVRADGNIYVHDDVTAAVNAEFRADFDLDGSGSIGQTAGTITAASGNFAAAEGIDGAGGRGVPPGLMVSLDSLSAVNRDTGSIRIVQTAAGGNLTTGLIRNVPGPVVLHILDGSLIDGNGSDLNIEAAFADISIHGGSLGSISGDVFRGAVDTIEVNVSGTLSVNAPDGFAVVSGRMGGQVLLTAASAYLQSAGDVNLSGAAPSITNNLAILSGGLVRLPDSGLAVTGDLRLEALSVSSQTSGNPVVLGTTAAHRSASAECRLSLDYQFSRGSRHGGRCGQK